MAQTIAKLNRINVSHLQLEELDYELNLRGLDLTGSAQEKILRLKPHLRNEEIENYDYNTTRTVAEECILIEKRLGEIETRILTEFDIGTKSRLYHYFKRLRRSVVNTQEEEETKLILIDMVKNMLSAYFEETIGKDDEYRQFPGGNAALEPIEDGARGNSKGSSTSGNKSQGAVPKKNVGSNRVSFSTQETSEKRTPTREHTEQSHDSTRRVNHSLESSRSEEYVHVSEIDGYVNQRINEILTNRLQESVNEETVNRLASKVWTMGNTDREMRGISLGNRLSQQTVFSTGESNRIVPNRRLSVVPGNLKIPTSISNILPSRNTSFNRSMPSQSDCSSSRRTSQVGLENIQNPFDSPRRQSTAFTRPTQRFPHQTCKILGTWPKFSGDSSSVPLVTFLKTIDMLCRSYEIDKEELIPHAHLLFTGDAYTWYTTYVDRFENWDVLLYYLTIRYDNPNRDRFIKEEMRNRKQKPYELFSAFLTDIDALSQQLIQPMSELDKFELVVENMKMSYKRRLALEDIRSVEDLAQKCYRFDALEQNLFNPRSRGGNPEIHMVEVEDEVDEEEVNAVAVSRPPRSVNIEEVRPQQNNRNNYFEATCWNCRQNGHAWRQCPEPKRVFCHVCGFAGKISFNCPNKHQSNQNRTPFPKNGVPRNV